MPSPSCTGATSVASAAVSCVAAGSGTGHVAVLTGGGSGHYSAFAGLVGPGVRRPVTMKNYGAQYGLIYKQCLRENQLQIPLMQNQITASQGLFRISRALLGGAMYDGMRAAGFTKLPNVNTFVDETVLDAVYKGKATV